MQQITKNQLKYIQRIKNNSNFRKKEARVFVEGEHNVLELLKNKPDVVDQVLLNNNTEIKGGLINNHKNILLTVNNTQAKKLSFGKKSFRVAALINTSKQPNKKLEYSKGIYIGLVNVQDPFNVGTIFRTCEAFGVNGVLLFDNCVNPYNQKVVISSTGSVFRVPFVVINSVVEFIHKNKSVNFFGTAVPKLQTIPNSDSKFSNYCHSEHSEESQVTNLRDYQDITLNSGIILFGNEGTGLSNKILNITKENIYIPIKTESLNISVSAAIIIAKLNLK